MTTTPKKITPGKLALQILALIIVYIFGIATGVMLMQRDPHEPDLVHLQTPIKKEEMTERHCPIEKDDKHDEPVKK